MIFDSKCNETGVRYYQKEPKNFGPRSLGQIPVDRPSPKVELFRTWISPPKSEKIGKIRSLSLLNLFYLNHLNQVLFIKSGVIFAIWALFEGEISIKISREPFKLSKLKLKVKVINKPSILVPLWLLCHIAVLFFMNHAFLNF